MKDILSDRNTKILFDMYRFDLLSTEQILYLHFRTAKSYRSAYNVMNRLASEEQGFVDYTFARSETKNRVPSKPFQVWYGHRNNQKRLIRALESRNRFDEIEHFGNQFKTFNKDRKFANNTLLHEIGLNWLLIRFEEMASNHPDVISHGWIRTSLGHKLTDPITVPVVRRNKKTGQETEKNQSFNPDAILWLRFSNNQFGFYFIEFENDTSKPYDYRAKKLDCYLAFHKQALFGDLCAQINDYFDLGLSYPENADFQLLTVSKSANHMRRLFSYSHQMETETLFNFSHFDAAFDNPFGSIWLQKEAFIKTPYLDEPDEHGEAWEWDSYYDKYDDLIENATDNVRSQWLHKNLQLETLGVALL